MYFTHLQSTFLKYWPAFTLMFNEYWTWVIKLGIQNEFLKFFCHNIDNRYWGPFDRKLLAFQSSSIIIENWIGWKDFQECIKVTHFLIDCIFMLRRSLKCIEIPQTEQTPGPETLSKVAVWTNQSSAGSVLSWSRLQL